MWSRLPSENACIDRPFYRLRSARRLALLTLAIKLAAVSLISRNTNAQDQSYLLATNAASQNTAISALNGDPAGPTHQSAVPIPATPSPHEIGLQILHRTLHESVWGQPVVCDVRQSSSIFNRKMTGFGKYVRGGQGSGRMRFSMQIPAGDQMNSLLQVSDGELLYSASSIGDQANRTRIDLGKIRERLVITTDSINDPEIAMYLAVGGQAELLRNLCQNYQWTKVTKGKLDQIDVWWLTGELDRDILCPRAAAEIDVQIRGQNQSGLMPTEARLAVSRANAEVPFWLYQADLRRSAQPPELPYGNRSGLSILTEWPNPVAVPTEKLASETFEAQSTNDPFSEETGLYLPPPIPATVITAPVITAPAASPASVATQRDAGELLR